MPTSAGFMEAEEGAKPLAVLFQREHAPAMDTGARRRFGLAPVHRVMAGYAKRDAILNAESQKRIPGPGLDVVGNKVDPALAALLAGVVVAAEHVTAPLLVLVLGCALAGALVAFVAGVILALLEVGSASPVFGLRARRYAVHQPLPSVGIGPLAPGVRLAQLGLVFRSIGAPFGAKHAPIARVVPERLAAMKTHRNGGGILALTRAIAASVGLAGHYFKHLAAPLALLLNLGAGLACAARIAAFERAIKAAAVLQARRGNLKLAPTVATVHRNKTGHAHSKKEPSEGWRYCCLGNTCLTPGRHANQQKNRSQVLLPRHLQYITERPWRQTTAVGVNSWCLGW